MVRRFFITFTIIAVSFMLELFAIIRFFILDKTWFNFGVAIAGFVLLPVSCTVVVRQSKMLPVSKVIIFTGIWSSWVVLAGIIGYSYATLVTQYQNSPYPYSYDCCGTLLKNTY